ncbi:unnamed protein product, partial [marine sediment metagenome]
IKIFEFSLLYEIRRVRIATAIRFYIFNAEFG